MKLILTSEHGGNIIPKSFENYFTNSEQVLTTHSAYDIGSLDLFNTLKPLAFFHHSNTQSRLLIELNRSLHHKDLFSKFTRDCTEAEKAKLIQGIYNPYRESIQSKIEAILKHDEQVLHIAVHSFTPILNGVSRNCDIGLLYDPSRPIEKAYCKKLKYYLKNENEMLATRFNYPYLGKSDGFPTYLRQVFGKRYVGIELEINQKFARNNKMNKKLKQTIYKSLEKSLQTHTMF
ncbi:MAG: N-formylglutamate amidohydrolase [Bacteroidia bacterium]|nr:N-formylglutamate amidohydrolase [Winogradskyella sp.]MBT8377346.1 N-formylglutamate amidohydrolase [Bacteroidia bacterium]